MPRRRVNLPINKNQPDIKGKWLINLRNGKESQSSGEAIACLRLYLQALKTVLFEPIEWHGNYVDENIEVGGIVRNPSHWDTDVQGIS